MSVDDPDWAPLRAAHGPAEDVPALLHRLGSSSHAERSSAITDLWGRLCHQGTVYEASAVAAPLLLDAASCPDLSSEERSQLLALVVHIGLGAETTWQGYTPWTVVDTATADLVRCAVSGTTPEPSVIATVLEGNDELRDYFEAVIGERPPSSHARGLVLELANQGRL
jgi:hypothetical protein